MYIYGKNVAREKLHNNSKINKIYLSEKFNDREILDLIRKNNIKVSFVKNYELDKKVEGVVVTNIMPKSPAAAMRLQNGDVITAVNDKKVRSLEEFYGALESKTGSAVWFDVYSQGHTISTSKYKL